MARKLTLAAVVALWGAGPGADAATCECRPGAQNTWVTNRACSPDGYSAGPSDCAYQKDDTRSRCQSDPDAPEELYSPFSVWCDCMDGYGKVVMASTEEECMRTEGMLQEQADAYEAAGIDIANYECECCTCQATLPGVPKVGRKGKTCDGDSVDPDNHGCGNAVYWMFGAAVTIAVLTAVFMKLKKREEEKLLTSKKGGKSGVGTRAAQIAGNSGAVELER